MLPLDQMQKETFLSALNSLFGDRNVVGDGELYRTLRELQRIHLKTYPNSTYMKRAPPGMGLNKWVGDQKKARAKITAISPQLLREQY
jgi:hypothetical protein